MKTGIGIFVMFIAVHVGYRTSAQNLSPGKVLFDKNCARCHGKNGAKGFLGAKNLQKSTLADEQLLNIISNGKRIMPSWKEKLSGDEIKIIVSYIKTFRIVNSK
jgi:mono/diheme cytochrome c family protein